MLFKNREEAAEKLIKAIKQELSKKDLKDLVVISLLRGGYVLGKIISERLKKPHLPLASVKISSLTDPEYALGALCFDKIYSHRYVNRGKLEAALPLAEEKFEIYRQKFNLDEQEYEMVKRKVALVVDDGVATGSTAEAAALFLRQFQPRKIILAAPVAPIDFASENFDEEIILHKDPDFISVSQFYEEFPQVEIKEL